MEKIIHIHAKCKAFEFFEYALEGSAVSRLTDIRDGFTNLRLDDEDYLTVNTSVVNPELNFRWRKNN